MDRSFEDILFDIQKGNEQNREWLIGQYRPFILRSVRYVCKRKVEWNDDEASIGLIAFNEAIDRYDSSHGKTFDHFAFMMIRRRLIDEFRKHSKISKSESLVLDSNDGFKLTDRKIAGSLEIYAQQESAAALAQELTLHDERLQEYGMKNTGQCIVVLCEDGKFRNLPHPPVMPKLGDIIPVPDAGTTIKRNLWLKLKKYGIIAAAFLFLISITILVRLMEISSQPGALVAIDINPGFELFVDGKEKSKKHLK